jgi:hypothetical protein
MSHVLKGKCNCGGYIVVMPHTEKPCHDNNYREKTLVDYGVCTECLSMTILPSEDYFKFIEENCEYIEGL